MSISYTGEYLPPQLIYKGKTGRCHAKATFPDQWDIWHSENHWSNETTMQRYLERIIIPFVSQKRQFLKLSKSHPALAIFDGFRGQTTDTILNLLKDNNIRYVLVPANCTDRLQPLDVAINKPLKDKIKAKFQTWYALQVQNQLKVVELNQVKVDVSATVVKSPSANWVIAAWQSIESRPELAINGFQQAGIKAAISIIRD